MPAVDSGALTQAVVALAIAIFGGGVAMAWRLGGLDRRVKDTQDDIHELKGQTRDLNGKVDRLRSRIDRLPDRRMSGVDRREGE